MKDFATTDYSYCIAVGQTDVGRRRKANEDNGAHFVTKNGLVSVVCDGMGGHVGGAVASEIAVNTIRKFLDSQYHNDPREAIGWAIDAANAAIIQRATADPALSGMGSTCVLLLVRDAKVYIGHVGDSRVYLIRERRITQLTKDHSFVQMLVDMGEISKEQAEHHPRKNEITNALGLANMSPATVREVPITPQSGDCFLLCSDGLSGMVNDRCIEKIVSKQRELRAQERADLLVKTANENGGIDNITVELVEFTITPGTSSPHNNKEKVARILCLFFLLCFIICGGVWLLRSNPELKSKLWGEIAFERQQPVFTIEVNFDTKSTRIVFQDSSQVIKYAITDISQISTNLVCTEKKGNVYVVLFGNEIPDNMDSVFVQLDFGKRRYRYVLQIKKQGEELPVISLQSQKLARVTYAKNKSFASLTFIPKKNNIILSVDNTREPIEINGKLDTANIYIENARWGHSVEADNEIEKWTFEFDELKKYDNVIISFICEDSNSRKKYTYEIPIQKETSISKPVKRKEMPPKVTGSESLDVLDGNIENLDSLKGETVIQDSL